MPRYRIDQQSHIDDKVVEAGTEIETSARHVPGPHWKPLDDEAKALCKKHGVRYTGEVPDPTDKLSLQLTDALNAQGVQIDHDKLGAAIAKGLEPVFAKMAGAQVAAADGEAK